MSIDEADGQIELNRVRRRKDIPRRVEAALWGRAAGRCQFAGCNKPLWKSPVTQESVNIAEKAHIYAFSRGGPRGNEGIEKSLLNDVSNLLLTCHDCHRTIDTTPDLLERYPADRLQQWKAEHEARVELATGIDSERRSHVLLYGANVGAHRSPLHYEEAAAALFPDRYPAEDKPIVLGVTNSGIGDNDPGYWEREAANLRLLFEKRVTEPRSAGLVGHLSVFGLAPQPLLVLLGSLLIDIDSAEVYQRRREPPSWRWSEGEGGGKFIVREPANLDGPPALMFALSATIAPDRIRAIDPSYSIWEVTIKTPHNDFLQDRVTLQSFRHEVRLLLDRIKASHRQDSELAVFPAMPVACAIELGRVRMPKADLPWLIYDQLPGKGFVPTLRIPHGPGVQVTRTGTPR